MTRSGGRGRGRFPRPCPAGSARFALGFPLVFSQAAMPPAADCLLDSQSFIASPFRGGQIR
jgi:hypothetical protein